MMRIDLNCDMGELPEALAAGRQKELMRYISSANIACGGHAGDAQIMSATVEQAISCGVAIGAHPGYEDRANFGRVELNLSAQELASCVYKQLLALDSIVEQRSGTIRHVKVHGALYNQAARDASIARAIAEGVRRWRSDVVLVGLAGSVMLAEFRAAGFAVAGEAFADRRYQSDGSLRSRKWPNALVTDPEHAAAQALRIAQQREVATADGSTIPLQAHTICIHSDTPGALKIAAHVRRRLEQAGIEVQPLGSTD